MEAGRAVGQTLVDRMGWAPPAFRALARFSRAHPDGAVGGGLLLLIVLIVLLAPLVSPFPHRKIVARPFQGMMTTTRAGNMLFLGTDELGRDLLSRLLYGGRVSLLVGITAPLLGVAVGSLLGVVSAYYGRGVDLLVQRLNDAILVLPGLVVAMAVTVAFGFTVPVVILALTVANAVGSVRIVRSHVLGLKTMQYIEAARAIGASDWRIIIRHLLPNTVVVSIVLFSVHVGSAIVAEATLSFLGIGVQPPTPTWGNMLTNAQLRFDRSPHAAILPGVLIAVTVLCVNLFGDSLRDALDPRLRGKR